MKHPSIHSSSQQDLPTILVTESDTWAGFYASWALIKYHYKQPKHSDENEERPDPVGKVIAAVKNRNSEFVRELENMGAEIRQYQADASRTQLKKNLFRGQVDGIIYIPIHDRDHMISFTDEFLAAVHEDSKIQRLILWSMIGVESHTSPCPLDTYTDNHYHDGSRNWKQILSQFSTIEKQVRNTSISSQIILRHGYIAQQFFAFSHIIQNRGIFPFPSADHAFAPINAKDLARTSSHLITSMDRMNKFTHQTFQLTGPHAYTAKEIVPIINQSIHSQLNLKLVSIDDIEMILLENEEIDQVEVDITITFLHLIKYNQFSSVSPDLSKLFPHPPTDLPTFFRENSDSFRPRRRIVKSAPYFRDFRHGFAFDSS